MFIETILTHIHSFMLIHAPALLQNSLPLLIVAGYLALNGIAYFFTKGKEFAIVGWTGLFFLIPFIKFG